MAFLRDYCPLVTYVTGAPEFSEGLLQVYEQCLGKSSTRLIFFCSAKNIFKGLSSPLYDMIYFVAISPRHYVEEEIIK